jgi:hypothetical protein
MKMNLSNVSIDGISITNSKKNSGGAVCRIQLTATMTKGARKALGFSVTDDEWPPTPEKAGKLGVSFDVTSLILKAKQGNTLDEPDEVNCKISLADSFTWKFEDPKDESNTTVIYSFSARTADLEAAQLMVAYKFSASSGSSSGTLSYNKPGEGTAVDMSPEDTTEQLPFEGAEEEAAAGEPEVKRGRGRPRKEPVE